MTRPTYLALAAMVLLAFSGISMADGNAYDQYKSKLAQQQKDMKPMVNSQFIVTNATNRANSAALKGGSGKNRNIIQGESDGGANFDSVNIGPNARLNGATIVVKSDHSNSTIINKSSANK